MYLAEGSIRRYRCPDMGTVGTAQVARTGSKGSVGTSGWQCCQDTCAFTCFSTNS